MMAIAGIRRRRRRPESQHQVERDREAFFKSFAENFERDVAEIFSILPP